VCGKPTLVLNVNVNRFTLKQLYHRVFKQHLAMIQPCLDVFTDNNYIGLEEDIEDDKPQGYINRTLKGVQIGDGALLSVDDYSQNFQRNITVRHCEEIKEEENPQEFFITGSVQAPAESNKEKKRKPKKRKETGNKSILTMICLWFRIPRCHRSNGQLPHRQPTCPVHGQQSDKKLGLPHRRLLFRPTRL